MLFTYAVCHVALDDQDVSGTQRPKRVGRLVIEFDETSQMQRVRFGVSAAHAVFSVMAACPWDGWSNVSIYGNHGKDVSAKIWARGISIQSKDIYSIHAQS